MFEFQFHFCKHHEKYIQISTNMPSIGLVIPEIFEIILLPFDDTKWPLAEG